MEMPAAITASRKDFVWLVRISGQLTRNEESLFFQTYPWLHEESNITYILFDMEQLPYINSAGIALLIRFVREAQHRGYLTFACGVSSHYRKIFRIVGLTSYIELFQDEYSAMETLRVRKDYQE